MRLKNQYVSILKQEDFTLEGIKKFIELCGRVCYKSEDKVTDDSYIKFVNNLIKNDHSRPLEFGTVHLKFKEFSDYRLMIDNLEYYHIYNQIWIQNNIVNGEVYVTTNYRYYLMIISKYKPAEYYFTSEDNEFYPKRYTVKFYTTRGIADEFRTHVGLSHLMESTRWCNYSKGKFGNELTYIIPNWSKLKENTLDYSQFEIDNRDANLLNSLKQAELSYFDLIKLGCTAQEAREVLPLNIKAELISCGFASTWANFLYRRCDKAAHQMAQELANEVKKLLFK